MDRSRARAIVDTWMFPTEKKSYMSGLEDRPILASSIGSTVIDTDGKEYLDFQSGQMGAALGHQHPRIVKVIAETMKKLLHASNAMLNVPRLKLHERLGKLLPPPLQKSLFLVGGSDAIEAAADLARKATSGLDIIGFHLGLHGSTSYLTRSLSFVWKRSRHSIVAPATTALLAPHCYRCPLGLTYPTCQIQCLKTSLELADANFTSMPAAFIGEPILSAGGVIVPPSGYYQALQAELKRRSMLMILDESQTGLGKTGKLFGFQHEEGVTPDIITISKHFGGGLPISAVCTTADLAERAVRNGYFATRSHATDPLLCAVGEESLNVVVDEDMAGRAQRIEARIKHALAQMAAEFELIGDVRGRGVLLGVEFVTDRQARTPANPEVQQIASYCLDKGLIFQLRGTQGNLNVVRLVPPMVAADAEIDRAMSILGDAVAFVSRNRSRVPRAAE